MSEAAHGGHPEAMVNTQSECRRTCDVCWGQRATANTWYNRYNAACMRRSSSCAVSSEVRWVRRLPEEEEAVIKKVSCIPPPTMRPPSTILAGAAVGLYGSAIRLSNAAQRHGLLPRPPPSLCSPAFASSRIGCADLGRDGLAPGGHVARVPARGRLPALVAWVGFLFPSSPQST